MSVLDAPLFTAEADRADEPARGEAALVTEILEVLLEQDGTGVPITPAEVAERLPVPPSEVSSALTGLVGDGTAMVDGAGVVLSESGRSRATVTVRRHRLVERLLADVLGLEWWKVHHEAARLDGMLSTELERRVLDLLDDPGTCPHGNPIPGSHNQPTHPDAVALADAPVGPVHVVRITETLEGDDEALQLLQNCGFVPGRDAEVKLHQDGWVHVAGTVRDAALPPHVASHTYVAPR